MNLTHKESMQRSTHLVWFPTAGLIFYHSLGLGTGCGSNKSHCRLTSHSLWSRTRLLCINSPLVCIFWISDISSPFHQCWAPYCNIEKQDRIPCPSTQARDPQRWLARSCRVDKHSDPPQLCTILSKTLNKKKRRAGCRQWVRLFHFGKTASNAL